MTEQYIIGAMLKRIIGKDTDNKESKLFKGVGGGTSNIQPGMSDGSLICIQSIQVQAGILLNKVFIMKICMGS